jgi:hypothetical protein
MPVSRRDEKPLREIAEEFGRIARVLTQVSDAAGKSGEGRDHSADLKRIEASLAEITAALRGFLSE